MKLHDLRSNVPIKRFSGDYRFLSNFYSAQFEFVGKKYKTVEHFFQAFKTQFDYEHEAIRNAATPAIAKKLGRGCFIRPNWDHIKVQVMRDGLLLKFASDQLAAKLIATGNAFLMEGNTWHDNFWGNCSCINCKAIQGYNMLGSLLMELRFNLQNLKR